MSNFKNAFYGLNKTKSSELNTVINNMKILEELQISDYDIIIDGGLPQ